MVCSLAYISRRSKSQISKNRCKRHYKKLSKPGCSLTEVSPRGSQHVATSGRTTSRSCTVWATNKYMHKHAYKLLKENAPWGPPPIAEEIDETFEQIWPFDVPIPQVQIVRIEDHQSREQVQKIGKQFAKKVDWDIVATALGYPQHARLLLKVATLTKWRRALGAKTGPYTELAATMTQGQASRRLGTHLVRATMTLIAVKQHQQVNRWH